MGGENGKIKTTYMTYLRYYKMTSDYPLALIPTFLVDVVYEGAGVQGCWRVKPKRMNLIRIVSKIMSELPQLC